MSALTTLVTGGGFADTAGNLVMLIIITIIFWITALTLYRRRTSHE
jgi:hypothetical protein